MLMHSLQKAAEEHLQQQELLVAEVLEKARQRQETQQQSYETWVAEPRVDEKEVQSTQGTPSEVRAALSAGHLNHLHHCTTSNLSNHSHLRDYLDVEVNDLTNGVVSVHSRTATFSLLTNPSSIQRIAKIYKDFREPLREGLLSRIVTSPIFEVVTFIVIASYGVFAVWMTNSLLRQPEILDSALVVWTETVFLTFFTMELAARLAVHRFYFFCNADMGWNCLDFLIIISSLVDFALNFFTQINDVNYVRMVRALRISKSLRILRAVRFVNELRVLVNCIVASFTVLFWCVVLLLLIQAGVSTALVQLVAGYVQEHHGKDRSEEYVRHLEQYFGTVQASMMSLFQATTGGVDWGYHYRLLSRMGPVAQIFFVMYLLFFFVAAWNIVTSLFMEKAMMLSQPDVETQMLSKHREDMQHAAEIVKMLEETDTNNSGTISLNRFKEYMELPRFRNFFECRDLEIKDAEMFFRILSSVSNSEDVKYRTFAYGCMRMKGYASSLDVQCLRIELKTMYLNQANLFEVLSRELNCIKGQLAHKDAQDSMR